MRLRNLVLSMILGAAVTIGLIVALDPDAVPVEAQPAPAPAAPAIDHSDAISKALTYLQTKQLPTGGIEGWTPGEADDFTTIKTIVALAAARYPVSFLTSASGATPLEYMAARSITYTHDDTGTLFPGRAGMLAVAVVAGGGDLRSFGGMNILQELASAYHPATGAYSTTASQGWTSGAAGTTNQLWAILGLAAAQETVPAAATDFLAGLQEPDGGWGWGAGFGDVDTTALVVQALIASGNAGPTDVDVQEGLAFLRQSQAESGGWESWGSLSADSTAAAIQAVAAAGYTPVTESWARSSDPHTALLGLQAPDGSFSGNALGTAHAVAGLVEAPLPILGRVGRANRALTWLNERQNGDGSWSFFGLPDPGATCDAVLAYAAAGFDPHTVKPSGSDLSAMDYLSATASAFVTKTADSAGKLATAVVAAGGDPCDFGGVDIIHVLTNTWYSPTLGAFGVPTNTWHQAWAMVGLAAAGEPIPVSATQTLAGLQQSDGGWSYNLGVVWTTPDDTGMALQALAAAGVPSSDPSILGGIAFLRAQQDGGGGWGNANSTALAIQGLLAAGEDLAAEWARDGRGPYEALIADQKSDGPFTSAWFGSADNEYATLQAVPALVEVYYPFAGALTPFAGLNHVPDPDRTVAASPRATWGDGVGVIIPFGSDLDRNGSVALDWRAHGATSWVTGTAVHRADGCYTATLPVTLPVACDVRATFTDPDAVQYGGTITDTVVLEYTLEPRYTYLPLVFKR
jgi:hypothetical protein